MTRWRGGRGQRLEWAVPVVELSTWSRRLLVLGLAIGLIVMHHMVGAHQHGVDQPVPAAVSAASVAAAGPSGHGQHLTGPVEAAGRSDGSAAASAELHVHPDPAGHGEHGMMALLHMCLAVLAAALALSGLLVLAVWWRTVARDARPAARLVLAGAPRPPPVPLRLAQLQILRL